MKVLTLFSSVTTARCFLMVHLYNYIAFKTNLRNWVAAFMLSCQTCDYALEGNSSRRHLPILGCEIVALTTDPWFIRMWERRVPCSLVLAV